ncbi:MAG TPA: hypothetical protein VFS48_05785, partial [Solirubrobacterales bacterium]|nr:hypothetical protein [Solirubrobacterales bacterium]
MDRFLLSFPIAFRNAPFILLKIFTSKILCKLKGRRGKVLDHRDRNGRHRIPGGGFWLPISIACALLLLGPVASVRAVPLPNDFFGVSSIGQLSSEKEADELLRLGSHNVRNNFEWNKVQPADCNGTATAGLNWSYYDQRVRRAAEHNITLIADLYGTRLPAGCPTDPRQFPVRSGPMYNDWYQQGGYVWQLVQRYGVNG